MAKFRFMIGVGSSKMMEDVEIDDEVIQQCSSTEEKKSILIEFWNDWAKKYIEALIEEIK